MFRVNRYGKHEDVTANPITKLPVNLHEVRGCDRSPVCANRVHKIDDDNPVFDQVVIKAKRFIVLVPQ